VLTPLIKQIKHVTYVTQILLAMIEQLTCVKKKQVLILLIFINTKQKSCNWYLNNH